MISKSYTKTKTSCRVTFKVKPEDAVEVAVLGDFNEWNPGANPLKRRKDGTFSTTLSLKAGNDYRFRYLLDGKRWENDQEADGQVVNRFGSRDCVLSV
jgi:1,4-alpha-glucan branching enzyme